MKKSTQTTQTPTSDLHVVQKNRFIQKYQKQLRTLTFSDLLFFKTVVSKINAKDTLFRESYVVTYDELDKAGFVVRERYQEINKCLKALSSLILVIENKEEIVHCGIIQNKWSYPKRSKEVKIQVYPEMAEFLIGIKNQFTKYPLSILSNLTNKYDLILFEYFSSIKSLGSQKMKLETLKDLLDVKDKYTRTPLFKKELLDKSISRINEFTDIVVEYTSIKEGNKTTGFHFYIKSNATFSLKEYIKSIKTVTISIDNNNVQIQDIQEIQNENGTLYKIQIKNSLGMVGSIKNDFTLDELKEYIQTNQT